ncbi:MAG: ribosome silencing factor [Coriobacteriia bacterium]|nr:ribosome silencing factor [Coriobacteriia bacterium]
MTKSVTVDKTDIEAIVRIAAEAAAEKKAADVVALRVAELLVVTDYFLLATGANDRQVHAIADAVEGILRDHGVKPIGREGERELKWVLLDYGDFVVHVFQPDEREFYRLDKLWSDAPRLELPAEIVNASAASAARDADSEEPEESRS